MEDDERISVAEGSNKPATASMVISSPRLEAIQVSQQTNLAAQTLEPPCETDQPICLGGEPIVRQVAFRLERAVAQREYLVRAIP